MMLEAISVDKVLVQDNREYRNFGGDKSEKKFLGNEFNRNNSKP